ncbi:hypothetical protein J4E91_004384 [Alternaria rosae]|nr:hypothetical protein J4E91_004384 [Alternaria rosae]
MFGRHSAYYYRSFNADRKERLLGPNVHTILFKMGPARCRSTYILDHMEATVNFLMEFSYDQTQAQRERYRLALCNAMSAALSVKEILACLYFGPSDDSVKVRKNMGRIDTVGMLAAAAAVNSEPALRFLLDKVYDAGLRSQLYGTPLTAAAVNGHLHSATFIYERMENGVYKHNQLYDAIDTCMNKHHATILPTLMSWYLEYCNSKRSTREAKQGWADWALLNGVLDVLHFCYDPKNALRCKRRLEATPFFLACQYGHAPVIQYLLQIHPTLRSAIHTCRKGSPGARELWQGLTAAVENGWLVATRLLIHSGMRIDYGEKCGISCTPLMWYAVKGENVNMVLLLLAYGAVVPERDDIWALVANQGPEMAKLMQVAWNAQVGKK